MSIYEYRAYGLSIGSDLVCPQLPRHPDPSPVPDVTITLLPQETGAVIPLPQDHPYNLGLGYFQLDVPGVARYRVEEGRRILVQPQSDASPEKIRLFLFGSAMGALLYQRGLLPLHGSAVVTQWGGMIFVGPQGSGKSTLAAEFHRRGYQVLSDDVCAIENTPDGLRILPALAQFRLCGDAYRELGAPLEAYFDVDKFAVPMGGKYCRHSVPLRAIHILRDEDTPGPRVEPLRGLDRVRSLFDNLYRPQFLNGQRTQKDLVRLAGVIAQNITIMAVRRRRDTMATADLAKFLELTWASCFETGSCQGEEFYAHIRS